MKYQEKRSDFLFHIKYPSSRDVHKAIVDIKGIENFEGIIVREKGKRNNKKTYGFIEKSVKKNDFLFP